MRRFEMGTMNWRPVLEQPAHEAWVNHLALSADGKLLVTASDDRTAKAWEASTGELLRVFPVDRMVGPATFSPDGKTFAVGDGSQLTISSKKSATRVKGSGGQAAQARRTLAQTGSSQPVRVATACPLQELLS